MGSIDLTQSLLLSGHTLSEDDTNTKRIILTNFTIIMGFPIFLFFVYANLQTGQLFFAYSNVAILIFLSIAFVLLRRSAAMLNIATSLILGGMLITYMTALFQGGILNSGFLWYFLFPIFALFLKARRSALVWLAVLFAMILGFYIYALASGRQLPYNPHYLLFVMAALSVELLVVSFWYRVHEAYEREIRTKRDQLEVLTTDLESRVQEELDKSRAKDEILSQQSKMAGVGEMMSNIAHQWKQPLGTVNVIVQNLMLGRTLEQTDEELNLDESLQEILRQTKLMNQTVYDFLNFSKPSAVNEVFNLNRAVQSAVDLIRPRMISETIALKYDPPHESFEIFGKSNELIHVIMNIIANARDALLEIKPSQPWVELMMFADRDDVVLQISDNAGGIAAEHLERIFDVYYSTKELSGGTGLGLYMAKKIVEEGMQGELRVANTISGALFELRFSRYRHPDEKQENPV